MNVRSIRFKVTLLALAMPAAFALSACSRYGAETSHETPEGVAGLTTIDFADVANYAAPPLPEYFDETVEWLDNSPAGNPIDDKVATLGRALFYDMRMSTNNRVSCASCHQQAIGFTDWIRFSNGISSAATTDMHSMRLANLRYWKPGTAFWDRRADSLEQQVSEPIHNLVELGWGGDAGTIDDLIRKLGDTDYYPDLFDWAFGTPTITEPRMQQALAQFLRSMVSSSSRWDSGYEIVFSATAPNRALDLDLPNFSAQENRGRHLFMASVERGGAGCAACHLPPTFALSPDSLSNGLDAGETRLFKAPSLRNVGLSGPYMHDGRFATLDDVIAFYSSGIQDAPSLDPRLRQGALPLRLNLSPVDREALKAFLMTLTDNELITDEKFSDPFYRKPFDELPAAD